MADQASSSRRRVWRSPIPQGFGLVTSLLGLLFLACLVLAPSTLSSPSLLSMLPFAAIMAIAAIGQGFTIQQRGIDFSIAATISFTAMVVTRLADGDDGRLIFAIAVALISGVLIGVVNGIAIAKLKVGAIIATLAVSAITLGLIATFGDGVPIGASAGLKSFAVGKVLGIPNTVLVAGVFTSLIAILLSRTVIGRRFTLISTSPQAGRALGLHVDRYLIGTYAAAGFSYALAGIVLAGYLGSPSLEAGNPYLLASITAAVVGGTALGGGRGNVVGTALAALFLTQLNALIDGLGAPSAWQMLVQAGAIAVAAIAMNASVLKANLRRRRAIVNPDGT